MFIVISVITTLVVVIFFAKRIFVKRLQSEYEKSLLKGDKKKCEKLGREYYLSLDEEMRKSKGIINIEEKISDDFRSFNSHTFSILL
ncbi:MAG: hypothetical protein M3004_07120 [Bacteroidota bacterium]|nr:hypothetical protein [Bacteroidota bacterium]